MKIAYVANMRFPSERAHATQIVQMSNAFASLGHTVDLFVTTRKTAITEDAESYYGVHFAFRVVRAWIPDIVGVIHFFPRILHPYLYTLERILFGISFVRNSTHGHYDLVYCRDEWVLATISLFRPSQKIAWESLEAKHNGPARKLLAHTPVIVISDGILERYSKLGYAKEKFVVAHDAVDDSFFETPVAKAEAQKQLGIMSEVPVVMYIGGFDAWKGVETLFQAAALLRGAAVYVIGGKPDELSRFKTLYPKVYFLGSRPYKELPAHQQAADVLVIPNTAKNAQSASYTSPLKLFAHMTSKIPLVLSDIPSLRSVLHDDAGFFCTADDPEALAHAIEYVLQNPAIARQKADHAYKQSRNYTWKHRAQGILNFLTTVHD